MSSEDEISGKNPNAKWYILQAYAGYEARAEKLIYRKLEIAGLQEFVEEIFIPAEEVVTVKDGKHKKINQKYFPGYLFVRAELNPAVWHVLMNVDRVTGFVGGTQKAPHSVSEKEISDIRNQINEGFQQSEPEPEFSIGQKVAINDGPFNNFNGIIDEIIEPNKLKVLVTIFGRSTPVEIEFEKVKQL